MSELTLCPIIVTSGSSSSLDFWAFGGGGPDDASAFFLFLGGIVVPMGLSSKNVSESSEIQKLRGSSNCVKKSVADLVSSSDLLSVGA